MTGVSFIVTVYDKTAFLPGVIQSLARQTGDFAREFIFVDDGSRDGSADLIRTLTAAWPAPVVVVSQANRGASAATNAGAARATQPWLKLLDGDDLLLPGATALLLQAARETRQEFAYGDLATYRPDDALAELPATAPLPFTLEADGLRKFIRNCPANSSSILVSADRYRAARGCDERLVSPDQMLFLRLFATGSGAHVDGAVALVPDKAEGRLSGEKRRSRYESVLALYYLVSEYPELDPEIAAFACRRAFSRAARFHRKQGGALISPHLLRHLASRLPGSRLRGRTDPATLYKALGAFTENGSTERPEAWLPGALRSAPQDRPA